MEITFKALTRQEYLPTEGKNTVFLKHDSWDDFGFETLFRLTVFDEQGHKQSVGDVKIGIIGQEQYNTSRSMPRIFSSLEHVYSLGQDADYYNNLMKCLSKNMRENILKNLGDVVSNPDILETVSNEAIFNTSLLRTVNFTTLKHQFPRILRGKAELTNYNFFFERPSSDTYSGIKVNFKVKPNSKPSSNIHILIGRNGVGKTTLLNSMVDALIPGRGLEDNAGFFNIPSLGRASESLDEDYFAGVVSVSFSAFDPFVPPNDQPDANIGMQYYYIGLKKYIIETGNWTSKDKDDLSSDFTKSLKICFALTAKKSRWINAIKKLESDLNFAEMDLCQLCDVYVQDPSDSKQQFSGKAKALFKRMSSGHAIVLLTITRLVETVEEKTLVLLDEPESHLHPPLLSAFTRALSDLMDNRNGVAIIATHSPVVLQEVPKLCVSIIRRTRLTLNVDEPEIETFAENVGILTREVFGLEVSKSGFHDLLASSVKEGKSYEEIDKEYKQQLGFEGRVMLRSLISIRESRVDDEI
ncbi:AAA family ATPase [Shewanella electrodiphila]|uniref:AAA family ATPase n=1 Tax=Shewanella electrodiphila TaxID=934143 RepID=A0ABT0KVX1_9GAMM|nr:AAA family ATPase [Shewanella electrodiphila]MCL1047961.1 AAA family ATPase [Shewanella electrodiphila]